MTHVLRSVNEWKKLRSSSDFDHASVGFVPTMGALHEGHLSLIQRSKKENDKTVVSLFVNPTQFNDPADLSHYPRTFEEDLQKLELLQADYLFSPLPEEIYPDHFTYQVIETEWSQVLCGASRPGHFEGVLTVVLKLFNLIKAHRAYFGEKDFQQLKLIEGMVQAFFLETHIVACPTIRSSDGLALSSRNQRLKPDEREKAPLFHYWLQAGTSDQEVIRHLEKEGFVVDYIETRFDRRFGAVKLGNVRLIDNVEI